MRWLYKGSVPELVRASRAGTCSQRGLPGHQLCEDGWRVGQRVNAREEGVPNILSGRAKRIGCLARKQLPAAHTHTRGVKSVMQVFAYDARSHTWYHAACMHNLYVPFKLPILVAIERLNIAVLFPCR